MSDDKSRPEDEPAASSDVEEMIAEADTGARAPTGVPAKALFAIPLVWSLFQLWYASPLPFMLRLACSTTRRPGRST